MALEASNSEVKRIVGEALGETFGERDAATAAARSLAEAFRALRARRASTLGGHDGRERTRRDDTWVEDDRELDAETEAALEEALETVRKWKSEAEREREARRDAEAELSEAREEVEWCPVFARPRKRRISTRRTWRISWNLSKIESNNSGNRRRRTARRRGRCVRARCDAVSSE